jgi:hypothetical protein
MSTSISALPAASRNSSWRRFLFAALAAGLAASATATAAAADRVRVSVKVILDGDNDTPSGDYGTVEGINEAIAEANSAAWWSGLCWRIRLTEVGSLAGLAHFFVIDDDAERLQLDEDAVANPGRFAFRANAINIYIVDEINTPGEPGGSCSFPVRGDGDAFNTIVIRSAILNGGVGWLHEIGHFLSLVHTFECYADGCDEDICRGQGAFFADANGDGVKRTCPDVCPDDHNVMSYNGLSPDEARFSGCQRDFMELQLFLGEDGGLRGNVVERQPIRVAKFGEPYLSVRQGVDAACPGGTVQIRTDVYAESNLFPRKWVILQALQGAVVITPP